MTTACESGVTAFSVNSVFEVLNKVMGDSKSNTTVCLALLVSVYIGKMHIDDMTMELKEVKKEQKEITKLLAEHATTWARIAERVEILKKGD